ncbi:MAG: hypothetical protein L0H53_03070 [Candidatus Nitrosocosmicus sp.]|nr:hypothetical protein [Candidatus Nitrosocosmicus sp.]MDN5867810.1 hypothetical protein [Candidatus Nitrosocosmicus sp.]
MTKTNSSKVKNRVILPVVIIAAVIIMGVFLTNPVISFVTAIQSSNMTTNERGIFSDQLPKINGSINVLEKAQVAIENDLKTSFVQAADIAARQSNNDTILLGGHLGVDQGYLVYNFFAINPSNHTGYKTIVDAGNGSVLYKSEGIQMLNFYGKSVDQGMGHGIFGFSGEHGYGHGQGQEHESFGFGHWKGPWGFHDQGDNNGNEPWR